MACKVDMSLVRVHDGDDVVAGIGSVSRDGNGTGVLGKVRRAGDVQAVFVHASVTDAASAPVRRRAGTPSRGRPQVL